MTIYTRKEWAQFTRAKLYRLAKYYKDQGEKIDITSRSKKDEIIGKLMRYFEEKSLPKAIPDMSARVRRIWEAGQKKE